MDKKQDLIRITYKDYYTDIEITDDWEETKQNILGGAHRILLAHDRKRQVIEVEKLKTNMVYAEPIYKI